MSRFSDRQTILTEKYRNRKLAEELMIAKSANTTLRNKLTEAHETIESMLIAEDIKLDAGFDDALKALDGLTTIAKN